MQKCAPQSYIRHMKAIAFVRVSTSSQEIEEQTSQLLEYIKRDGWNEDDIILVGAKGASAIKENDEYKQCINEIYMLIDGGSIACVYCWELSRIFRNKVTGNKLISTLEDKKIQLKIMQPSLYLLDPITSEINTGMELAITLFITLAEQEMKVKKARFARTKARNSREGKYNGGRTIPFGYSVNENGFFYQNDDADVVRQCFEKYASGNFSLKTLSKEMNKLGHDYITHGWLHRVLSSPIYIGKGKKTDRTYPRIVSDELFDMVANQLKGNITTKPRSYKHHYFSSRLVKCDKCGCSLIAGHDKYQCKCGKSKNVSIAAMDGLLWWIAFEKEGKQRAVNTKDRKNEIKAEIANRTSKINAVGSSATKVKKRQQRVKEAYLDGIIDKTEYQQRTESIKKELEELDNFAIRWREEIALLNEELNTTDSNFHERMLAVIDDIGNATEQDMCDIVHKWIKRVEIEGDMLLTIDTADGRRYYSKYNAKSKAQQWSALGGEYLPVYGVMRDGDRCYLNRPTPNGTTMQRAIYHKEGSLGVVKLIEFVGKFWSLYATNAE